MPAINSLVLVLALCLLPVYTRASGGMQISHYLLTFYCLGFITWNGIGRRAEDGILVLLVLFIFARESVAVWSGDPILAFMPAVELTFSLMIFNVLRRVSSERVLNFVLFAIVLAAGIAVASVLVIGYSPVVGPEGGRAIGTFNNPNQLGYFAVCLFAVTFVFRLRNRLSAPGIILMVASALFLAIASLSKAAMVGVGFGAIFAGFAPAKRRTAHVLGVAMLALLGWAGYTLYTSGALSDVSFVRRLQDIGSQGDDSFEARGYQAFFDGTVAAMIFGYGSQEVLSKMGREVHSTLFSFFVAYGVLGGTLFSGFILLWIRRVRRVFGIKGLVFIVSPVMLYGIAHNGSRFTFFWILLALSSADVSSASPSASRRRRPKSVGCTRSPLTVNGLRQ